MLYTLAEAAKASGLAVSAIRTAIERGQIAARRDLFDEWQVEDSELHRLHFPIGAGPAKRNDGAGTPPASAAAGHLEFEAQLKPAAHGSQNERPKAGCESNEPDSGSIAQGTPASPPEPGSALSGDADSNGTEAGHAPLSCQNCLTPFPIPGGRDRQRNEDTRLQFSALDNVDRIALENVVFWESEIKIGARQHATDSAKSPVSDRKRTILAGAALLTAFLVGWIGGVGTYHFGHGLVAGHSATAPAAKRIAAAENERRERDLGALVTGKITPGAVADNRAKRRSAAAGSQAPESRSSKWASVSRQTSTDPASDSSWEPSPAGVARDTNDVARRVAVPETRPTTVEGWTVRSVSNGTVILEGPGGVWTAARGETVPGLGRVDSIVLWGSRWIVATTRGLVTTP